MFSGPPLDSIWATMLDELATMVGLADSVRLNGLVAA
jgi:hypothetical protein